MNLLNGYDYTEFLKRKLMVGQIDPWRRTEEGKSLYTLLVNISTAMDECKLWSKQEFSKKEFIDHLKLNDVLIFNNIEDFVKAREANPKTTRTKTGKRNISEETRKILSERMKNINSSKQALEKASIT